ncbi:hypothetical protein AQF52_2318 [Streptomyces venezuelae]|uniref:hypothetical protein n=1 Tax=Streptomyces gardneri TaxID=66892 RepID=UPI0006BC15D9|nr:hypothetical protein [Streptomyces gardneri]ALO07913.1 hypothetical protein AQF52_2318 [Streptomyces venezuelae]QPK45203.1 hypothetical protein H4W23_11530 [Streptomyces gardneri]WRK36520.1 hypothetical protein U0M97_11580 [Streptomyces venezuelae]CUM41750.1 hypothetical protein BN2537_12465 [Streptomyces venezuelae]
MSDIVKVVRLYAKEAPVGVLDGRMVGLLEQREQAHQVEWAVSPEGDGFRLTVKGTEETVVAESGERAPVAVRPDDSPASVWRLQRVTEDGVATVLRLDDLRDGVYVIDQNGFALGRDLFEDRSQLPKRVFARTDDRDPQWRIEVLV